MSQPRSSEKGQFAKGIVILVMLALPALAFGFVGGLNPFTGPSTQLADADDPIRNGLNIFDRKDNVRRDQVAPKNADDGNETVLMLKNWDYTDGNGCSRR